MPRRSRNGSGGLVFHVMNRSARRLTLFDSPTDYRAFEQVLCEAAERVPMRLLCYAVMPNHWHLVLWPLEDHDLSRYMKWLTMTHAERWHLARGSVGTGAVYQGRFKAIPTQRDPHFLAVCRYVERNPLRAGLVERAEDWPWSSAWKGDGIVRRPPLHSWPVARPEDWIDLLNQPEPAERLGALRGCVRRDTPFGTAQWKFQTATQLGWKLGLRGRGRPPRSADGCKI